jgi:hypothetical protein
LNLKDIVSKSAEDLGIPVMVIDPGGSDQETFRNPAGTNSEYYLFWGEYAGIANMTRVKSSIMIDSEPLFVTDRWTSGMSGWIHTPYDNSTTTQTLDWVSVDRLGNHIQVTGLSVMRVLSAVSNPISLQLVGAVVVAGVVATAIIYFERSRVSAFFAKASAEIRTHIEERELLYIIMLTAIFLFISYISFSATGKTEVIIQGFPETRTMQYFGAPFKMIGMEFSTQPSIREDSDGSASPVPAAQSNTVVLWQGLILNAALFFLLAFIITYSVKKINHIRARAKLLKA